MRVSVALFFNFTTSHSLQILFHCYGIGILSIPTSIIDFFLSLTSNLKSSFLSQRAFGHLSLIFKKFSYHSIEVPTFSVYSNSVLISRNFFLNLDLNISQYKIISIFEALQSCFSRNLAILNWIWHKLEKTDERKQLK